ncbi:MAG: hypothetical protein P8L77_03895 [Gammaproteobacteria bacterium]|nr:hypothetical protein [Gammaproteobacteria bacterium]
MPETKKSLLALKNYLPDFMSQSPFVDILKTLRLSECLVKRKLTLNQVELQNAYEKINPEHYQTIKHDIIKGMCYGYSIHWLASMRATQERKLLDDIQPDVEETCFFKIIEILNKYHETPDKIPEETKIHLQDGFGIITRLQKQSIQIEANKQPLQTSPFTPNKNIFGAFPPKEEGPILNKFYTELYETLSHLPAGTCIVIHVPIHAIGLYIGQDKLYMLDPNAEETVEFDKFKPGITLSEASIFDSLMRPSPNKEDFFISKMQSIINLCYSNPSDLKFIGFHLITQIDNEVEKTLTTFMDKQFKSLGPERSVESIDQLADEFIQKETWYDCSTILKSSLVSKDDKQKLTSALLKEICYGGRHGIRILSFLKDMYDSDEYFRGRLTDLFKNNDNFSPHMIEPRRYKEADKEFYYLNNIALLSVDFTKNETRIKTLINEAPKIISNYLFDKGKILDGRSQLAYGSHHHLKYDYPIFTMPIIEQVLIPEHPLTSLRSMLDELSRLIYKYNPDSSYDSDSIIRKFTELIDAHNKLHRHEQLPDDLKSDIRTMIQIIILRKKSLYLDDLQKSLENIINPPRDENLCGKPGP